MPAQNLIVDKIEGLRELTVADGALVTLDLKGKVNNAQSVAEVIAFFARNGKCIERLDFSDNSFDSVLFIALISPFSDNLKEIILMRNRITGAKFQRLLHIPCVQKLKILKLAGNPISYDDQLQNEAI